MRKPVRSSAMNVFICQMCGNESVKWLGRCPKCSEWNSYTEKSVKSSIVSCPSDSPQELSRISIKTDKRFSIPMPEFSRVLGGGLVSGSLVLIAGDPGIGKSTLLLQVSSPATKVMGKVVYVSGEETLFQAKLRAERINVKGDGLYLITETDLDIIFNQLEKLAPTLVVIDSIQAVYLPELEAALGSITQVRECTLRIMHWAKMRAVSVFITGHVTKEGAIAGPRVLEHIVDVVLYLEGELFSAYRLLRCIKNRFGSTNEVGVFEMKSGGLEEVDNPSETFLSRRNSKTIGSVVIPALEGSRTLLIEVQALNNPTSFGLPRRTANGVDFNRLLLVTAVLARRVGLKLSNQDIMVNITGGLKVGEPAADLGIALAIASSYRDLEVATDLTVVGEIGLSGELRSVSQLERRVSEAARLGFKRCIIPRVDERVFSNDIQLLMASKLQEAIRLGLCEGKSDYS